MRAAMPSQTFWHVATESGIQSNLPSRNLPFPLAPTGAKCSAILPPASSGRSVCALLWAAPELALRISPDRFLCLATAV